MRPVADYPTLRAAAIAEAEVVLGEEREVETDEHEHERQLAQSFVELLARELGEPEVDAGEGGEH